jgi:hypothetical protein
LGSLRSSAGIKFEKPVLASQGLPLRAVRFLNASPAYNDGLNTHTWNQGDFTGDGYVDGNDSLLVSALGQYGGGVVTAAGRTTAGEPLDNVAGEPTQVPCVKSSAIKVAGTWLAPFFVLAPLLVPRSNVRMRCNETVGRRADP